MPSSTELPTPTSANLTSLPELNRSLDEKGTAQPGEGLYPRDGVVSVTNVEGQIAEVTIPTQVNNIVWASGMSAVRETINFAAAFAFDHGTRKGGRPIIACANELYSQSSSYFEKERKKGVGVVGLNSGDDESVIVAIEDKGADVFFAETVANTPGMPVLNTHKLLEHIRGLDTPPTIVLDNTLPLSTGFSFEDLLRPDDPVIVVESGTKNLMNNSELLGVSYSPNSKLIAALRKHKAHSGAVNSISALDRISDTLKLTLPGFHDRNRTVFNSTGKIALALAEAQADLGTDADFYTTFPTDPNHPNHAYAERIVPDELDFISPVVFITANDWSEDGAPNLIRRIAEHHAIREQIEAGEVHLGQSFGFPKARILYDRNAPNVRFAGGYELEDVDALAVAIREALADK